MTGRAELELAIAHLMRARELAAFFQWPEEQQKRIDLLFRGACDLRKKLTAPSAFSTAINSGVPQPVLRLLQRRRN